MSKQPKIILIGDGFSTAEVARNLLPRLASGSKLSIIGANVAKTGMFGRGIAYGFPPGHEDRRLEYLLNSTAMTMGEDFVQWVAKNIDAILAEFRTQADKGNLKVACWLAYNEEALSLRSYAHIYFPRALFGDFKNLQTENALKSVGSVDIERTGDVLISDVEFSRGSRAFILKKSNGDDVGRADMLVLAPGAPGPRQFVRQADVRAYMPQLYGHEQLILQSIRNGRGPVAIIGGNAAMLDAVRMVRNHADLLDRQIIVLTPAGKPPVPGYVMPEMGQYPLQWLKPENHYPSVDALLAEITRERDNALALGYGIVAARKAVRALNHCLPDMVPPGQQNSPKLIHADLVLRRGTPEAVDEVLALVDSGLVKFVAGKVATISATSNGVALQVASDAGGQTIEACVCINTTGGPPIAEVIATAREPAIDPWADDPAMELVANLVKNQLISLHPGSGHMETGGSCEGNVPGLYLVSPAVAHKAGRATSFPQYDVEQLGDSARAIVQHIIKTIGPNQDPA